MQEYLIGVMGEEMFARTLLALMGLVLGAIPLVLGIVHKVPLGGILAFVLCGAVSGIGLPQFSMLIAVLGSYLLWSIASRKKKDAQVLNRKKYNQMLNREKETGKIREREYVENTGAANVAWPPIAKTVNEEAMKEYEAMIEAENEAFRKAEAEKKAQKEENSEE